MATPALVSHQMTSEKPAQKFHTDDASLPRSRKRFWLAKNFLQPIRSTTQIWVVTRHQYGISALVSQTSFGGETSWKVAKCRLFSQAMEWPGVEQCSCVHCRLLLSKKYLSVPFSYIHTYILYCFLQAKGAFQQQSLFTSVKYINKLQHST